MLETTHLYLLLATFAGWVGRQQTQVLAYPIEENRERRRPDREALPHHRQGCGLRSAFQRNCGEHWNGDHPDGLYQAPNLNAYAERFARSIKSECLDPMVLVGSSSLDRAVAEYVFPYHDERGHQGIGDEIVSGVTPQSEGSLGGLISYHHRRAA